MATISNESCKNCPVKYCNLEDILDYVDYPGCGILANLAPGQTTICLKNVGSGPRRYLTKVIKTCILDPVPGKQTHTGLRR